MTDPDPADDLPPGRFPWILAAIVLAGCFMLAVLLASVMVP